MLTRRDIVLSTLASGVALPARGQTAVDPPSRAQLFDPFLPPEGLSESYNGAEQNVPLALPSIFRFPADAKYDSILNRARPPSIFGIDISGWTDSNVPLGDLRLQSVGFVYAKASQGTNYWDKKFSAFWSKLGAQRGNDKPWRGAYHFLSSSSPGAAQADFFANILDAQGGLQAGDMAPALDLEWDIVSKDGPDQWAGRGKNYILDSVLGCLARIKERTGRAAVLYTAKSWFSDQTLPLADFDKVSGYPLWVADYRPKRKLEENPDYPGRARPALWQFTDGALLTSGFGPGLDASIFNGSEAEFKKVFQIS